MGFYDLFSNFYDASLEKSYAQARSASAAALELQSDSIVLDAPCGTGQSFPAIGERLRAGGVLIGVDMSAGMLARARQRADKLRAAGSSAAYACVRGDAGQLGIEQLRAALVGPDFRPERPLEITRLHVFLGMSVFPDMQGTFDSLWSLLAPGGRCVLVDVHAERLGFQGHAVNLIARADIRRRFWQPLERVARAFELRDLPHRKEHGGQIMLATGTK
jgi:SAM-dependent methyltransferase